MKIKDIPINERPIERLKEVGVEHLNNEELIAILIRTGTKNSSSKEVALNLLKEIKQISNLNNITLQELIKVNGIGDSKASIILSAIELSKRINIKKEIKKITSSEHIYELYRNKLAFLKQEEFHCVYLDNAKNIIVSKKLFKGTINFSVIHPREIFKEAIKSSASSIICIHNHPSGSPKPSEMDIKMTANLVEIGNLMGIPVIDHIIISSDSYFSFCDSKLIK